MSLKKWRQIAEEKSKLDEQTKEIHQNFKRYYINKEFGQLSGEEFFKPITKRLDEKSTTVEEEEEEEEEEQEHIQKSQTFEPTVNKSCGKLTIEGNATTTKKCMEIKKFREISLDQFVKV